MTNDPVVLQQIVNDLSLDYPEKPTLLDHFAGLALPGILANDKYWHNVADSVEQWVNRAAEAAYTAAEEMIKERNKRMLKQ